MYSTDTEWQWPISDVHFIMMEKSALPLPLSLYLPSRTKLLCILQLRGQINSPYFISTPICTRWCTLCRRMHCTIWTVLDSNVKSTIFQDRKLPFCCFRSKKDRMETFLNQNSGSKQNVFCQFSNFLTKSFCFVPFPKFFQLSNRFVLSLKNPGAICNVLVSF